MEEREQELQAFINVLGELENNLKNKDLSQLFFLYDEDGNALSLFQIAQFWQNVYPEDIFISRPDPIIKIRNAFKELLEMKK